MAETEIEFLQRLRATFALEAQEHIATLSSGLLRLETAPESERGELVETVFRSAHSLKGAARAVNELPIEQLCQEMESTLSALKGNDIQLSPELLDRLLRSTDVLRRLIEPAQPAATEVLRGQGDSKVHSEEAAGPSAPFRGTSVSHEQRASQSVRISTDRLERLMLQVEEMVSAKVAMSQHTETVADLRCLFEKWRAQWNSVDDVVWRFTRDGESVSSVERARVSDFLERNESLLHQINDCFTALEKPLRRDQRALNSMVDGLLGEMKAALMLPFSSLRELMLRMVRDVARERGKDVDFVLVGGEVEVDRRILQDLKDPLIHLARNAVDHGIESPEERVKKNKPARGVVKLEISQRDSNKVEVRLSDDGKGLDEAKLKEAAVQIGAVSSAEISAMTSKEAASLVFRSGVSTASSVSSISGRGLGLAIVQEKVEKLGGTIALQTEVGRGTTFEMTLPLTLSTFRGVIVGAARQQFVLPTLYVERTVRVQRPDIKTVSNKEIVYVNGDPVSLVRLADVLDLPNGEVEKDEKAAITVVLVRSHGQRLAIAVDAVEREQDMLLKNLGRQLVRVRNFSGATILGNGHVLPVLHVPDLLARATRFEGRPAAATVPERPVKAKKSILVVDDSITSRTLLKSILESNGYRVETAIDGVDGLTKARGGDFSLIVSDVEMPRMTGFELATKIRADRKLSELPLILVTALASPADQERGMDVGANAYIVKSSFDQSNLLEAVRRLT